MMQPLSASVVGLGRIGLPFSVFLASRGVDVKGVESDERRRDSIRTGNLQSNEPLLEDLYVRYRHRFEVTDLAAAVRSTELSFVVVPTPSQADGTLSKRIVEPVVREIAAIAGRCGYPHLIVVVSTLMPGTLSGSMCESLRSAASPIDICYSPAFVALGSVFDGLHSPSFVLIGADNENAGNKLAAFYAAIGYDASLIARTDTVNAEIAKLMLNTYLAMKVSFANSVAELCQVTPGGCAESVLNVVGRDYRVGNSYLRGGSPYGGPCLPRDVDACIRFSEDRGVTPVLGRAVRQSNDNWYLTLLQRILESAPGPGMTVGVVGLTYKPNTDYFEHGLGSSLARDLAERGFKVVAHEPGFRVASYQPQRLVEYVETVEEVARASELCVLTYRNSELYERLKASAPRGTVLIDIWRAAGADNADD